MVLILGQASAVLHFELVPHRFCLLHGLEDIQVLEGAPAYAHASPAPAALGRERTARAPRTIVVSHDRCALAMRVHERLAFLPAERSLDIPAPDSTGVVDPARDATLLPTRPDLDFASKISPPA